MGRDHPLGDESVLNRRVMSSPASLVQRYVDQVLNDRDIAAVSELFSETYRDHDPLSIPGVIGSPQIAGRSHIEQQSALLCSSGVDMYFTLEDVFNGGSDRAAYRLFGEGTVPISAESVTDENAPHDGTAVKKLSIRGTRLALHGTEVIGRALGDKLHVTYTCVGIFRISDRTFQERWGKIELA